MSESTATAAKRPAVTATIGSNGVTIEHDGAHVGTIIATDIHADAHPALILMGARALLASARNAEGVAARIAALKAGKTSTREPGKSGKGVSPLIRAIGLADAHKTAQELDPKVARTLPGGKPNPAYDALVSAATLAASTLSKDARKAAAKRKDVMIRLAELIGE